MTPLRRARRRRLPPPLASLLFSLAALATLPMANAADAAPIPVDAEDATSSPPSVSYAQRREAAERTIF